jgi:hypothetical protein
VVTIGTEFIIHKSYKHLIIDFHPQNDKMCSQNDNERESFIATIFVGSPIEETYNKQNYAVYYHLKRLYLKTPDHDTKVFNAKICKKQSYAPNVGN